MLLGVPLTIVHLVSTSGWLVAPQNVDWCCAGHMGCLVFAIQHGCPVNDNVLHAAVKGEQLAVVDLLVTHGLPRAPYVCAPSRRVGEQMRPDELRCIQRLLGLGRRIHPGSLIQAATRGDVDFVHFLHQRGIPLWEAARERTIKRHSPKPMARKKMLESLHKTATISIPHRPENAERMWASLRYGWARGAPLTPAMERLFRAKRAATRETLLCFHVSSRMGRGEGSRQKLAAWAAMGRMPIELIEKILLLAKLEVPESIHHTLPKTRSVRIRTADKCVFWVRGGEIRVTR
jgi:hypothetical protein